MMLNRRNLVFTTALLFTYYITGSSFEGVSGFGAKFKIEKPELIINLVWVIWAYFFLRYYQAFNEEGKPDISSKYNRLLIQRAIKWMNVDLDSISDMGFLERIKIIITKNKRTEHQDEHRTGFGKKATKRKEKWLVEIKMNDGSDSFPFLIHHSRKLCSGKEVFFLKRYSKLKLLVLYPHYTEYYFPFLFSILMAGYVVAFHTKLF